MRALLLAAAVALAPLSLTSPANAQAADPVEAFYKGKNLNMLVGVSAGGAYDLTLRLVARHIVRFIPGNPTPVPQNMTGATGLVMANYLYNVAPKDGTYIGLIQNGLPTYQAVGMDGVQFDARKLEWIGSPSPTIETMIAYKKRTGVATIDDARQREVIVGSIGSSGITYMYPLMLNDMAGTKFRMVPGYTGSGALNLAMERGEVDARNNSWGSVKANKPDWIKNGDIAVLTYSGRKQPDLANVPHLEDLIKDKTDLAVFKVVTAGSQLGHPFAMAPGVPADRLAAVRKAFAAMLKSPEFLKEATAAQIEVDFVEPDEMRQVVNELFSTPQEVRDRARKYFDRK
ncbi:MAG: Bug family tripartite tricarboxylate transporter substrate binding protein [Beijerinckiaceae bacterium]